MEKFESNINTKWEELFNKYGVAHVFDLPREMYVAVHNEFIHEAGVKLFKYLSDKGLKIHHISPFKNPYLMASGCIQSYNIFEKKKI